MLMAILLYTVIGLVPRPMFSQLRVDYIIDSIGEGLETAHVSYTFVRRLERALREVANWLLIGL